ncbi:phage late control D family protein [Nostoc parmelioides]|uniref:Phage late control D family protein n=1 Tax=Nostoc parmelioides FACHB-3921 TaxID=2692909 RepID=A0ABR8BGZ7_9NOSO|nr:contractile injection system protein, VgrG/Pvc8 family [Nostoc parmelioides]MBD2251981.1 phage late control D family protein [Nostoc parmelioides FACHB-3921]
MANLTNIQLLSPSFKFLIQGKTVEGVADTDISRISVFEDIDVPGMVEISLNSWDLINNKLTWIDHALFDIGKTFEVQMGYGSQLGSLLTGEITALEPEFVQNENPRIVVRGHDFRHRLMRGQQTQSFTKLKDSDIARQIAQKHGLTADVKDSQVILEYVLQHNQTDLAFLQNRAQRIGYEVTIDHKSLKFHPRSHASKPILTLKFDEQLTEFFPRLSSFSQVGQVEVLGWSPTQKQPLRAMAGVGKETTRMAGKATGSQVVKSVFGAAHNSLVDRPISTKAEAEQIAASWFNDMALSYIEGDGVCLGTPDLHAGQVIDITGVGNRFSGQYYVTSVRHTYDRNSGYNTSFTVRRNAS